MLRIYKNSSEKKAYFSPMIIDQKWEVRCSEKINELQKKYLNQKLSIATYKNELSSLKKLLHFYGLFEMANNIARLESENGLDTEHFTLLTPLLNLYSFSINSLKSLTQFLMTHPAQAITLGLAAQINCFAVQGLHLQNNNQETMLEPFNVQFNTTSLTPLYPHGFYPLSLNHNRHLGEKWRLQHTNKNLSPYEQKQNLRRRNKREQNDLMDQLDGLFDSPKLVTPATIAPSNNVIEHQTYPSLNDIKNTILQLNSSLDQIKKDNNNFIGKFITVLVKSNNSTVKITHNLNELTDQFNQLQERFYNFTEILSKTNDSSENSHRGRRALQNQPTVTSSVPSVEMSEKSDEIFTTMRKTNHIDDSGINSSPSLSTSLNKLFSFPVNPSNAFICRFFQDQCKQQSTPATTEELYKLKKL